MNDDKGEGAERPADVPARSRDAEPSYSDDEFKEDLRRLLEDERLLTETAANLPDYARDLLSRAASGEISESEFLREVFVGDCPNCESRDTVDCDTVEGIEDITVGLCRDCGFTWCVECGVPVTRGEICPHWQVCEECEEEKDEYDECGIQPADCPFIVEWIQATSRIEVVQPGCAWCGADISDEEEVFAVGAKIKEGIDFVGERVASSGFLPVIVAGKVVPAVVTAPDSQAKLEGNDIMFMVCGEQCADALKKALEEEKDLIDRIGQN
jgi:hypothetical protein